MYSGHVQENIKISTYIFLDLFIYLVNVHKKIKNSVTIEERGRVKELWKQLAKTFQLFSLFCFSNHFIHQSDNFFNINEIMTCQNLKTFDDSNTQKKMPSPYLHGPQVPTGLARTPQPDLTHAHGCAPHPPLGTAHPPHSPGKSRFRATH